MKTKIHAILLGLTVPLVAASVHAQEGPRYSSTGPTIISGVRLIDGLGNAPANNQDILVVDGVIAGVGPSGSLDAPEGALRIDGEGMTAMPGLIDMHIHLKGGWTGGNALPEKYPIRNTDPELQQTLSAFLYSGVTTVLDVDARSRRVGRAPRYVRGARHRDHQALLGDVGAGRNVSSS